MKDNISVLNEPKSGRWGGGWTLEKIQIFLKYLKAYLQIMKAQCFELIYFDGFAGSGKIELNSEYESLIESVALQVLAIDEPKPFDIYYLVELDEKKAKQLKVKAVQKFPRKKVHVVAQDCNNKLVSLSKYLTDNKYSRALAFIDPFGMQIKWASLETFKDLGCDMWILVPTGVAVNRMLTNDGDIKDSWKGKLEDFFGLPQEEIMKRFYQTKTDLTLFGEVSHGQKMENSIQKIIDLYRGRLESIWKFVSEPFPMHNRTGSIMYHFILASQNKAGKKIADEIISKMI